jgi:hypothetical protein
MLSNNHLIILLLILVLIYFLFPVFNENFTNVRTIIPVDQPIQDYVFKHKKILEIDDSGAYKNCNKNEIQIGEMCKDLYTEVYRRICNDDEKYSDGYCIKKCPNGYKETGNPHVCLSTCPNGTLDDNYDCVDFKFVDM